MFLVSVHVCSSRLIVSSTKIQFLLINVRKKANRKVADIHLLEHLLRPFFRSSRPLQMFSKCFCAPFVMFCQIYEENYQFFNVSLIFSGKNSPQTLLHLLPSIFFYHKTVSHHISWHFKAKHWRPVPREGLTILQIDLNKQIFDICRR